MSGSVVRHFTIDNRRENPTKSAMIDGLARAFDSVPSKVTFSVLEGGREATVTIQITGIEYETGNPCRLNFKGRAVIDGKEERIAGFYATDIYEGRINTVVT